jgi:hypothetical protein
MLYIVFKWNLSVSCENFFGYVSLVVLSRYHRFTLFVHFQFLKMWLTNNSLKGSVWEDALLNFLDWFGNVFICVLQVIETERMLYLVTEYASGGEIFGKLKDN